jgi:hypothetical protein
MAETPVETVIGDEVNRLIFGITSEKPNDWKRNDQPPEGPLCAHGRRSDERYRFSEAVVHRSDGEWLGRMDRGH